MREKHGLSKTPEYRIWAGICQRCNNSKRNEFNRYGGSGITLCAEWRESFSAFYQALGPRPSPRHSVDRIDNSKGYEPRNVRWATPEQQAQNSSIARPVTYRGRTMTVSEWARETGIGFTTLIARLNRGIPLDDVFSAERLVGKGQPPRMLEYGGQRLSVGEWARKIGVEKRTLKKRLSAGIPIERALQNPMPKRE